ncbi:MAG: Gfo/Idh/MocA family protein [Promethearchaeota archaeon]
MAKYSIIMNGCGGIANAWLNTINEVNKEQPGTVEIVAACDPIPEQFNKLEKFGWGDVPKFSDVSLAYREVDADITLILTPPQLHTRYAEEAVMNLTHVISEKPMIVDYNQLRHVKKIIKLAEENDIILVANQQYRWMPRIQAIRKAIRENLIGDINFVFSRFVQNRYHFNSWWRSQHEDISQLNWYVHHYDTMRAMLGKNPVTVRAKLIRPKWSKIYGESTIFLNVTFEDGIEWQYTATQEGIAAYTDSGHTTFEMFGSKGTIRNNRDESPKAYIEQPGKEPKVIDLGGQIENENNLKYPPGWKTTLLKTFEAIEKGEKHETSYEDNLWTMAIVLCARESHRRGGVPIDVKEYMQL